MQEVETAATQIASLKASHPDTHWT